MTSKSRIERNQGYMEAPQHFAALREKWPLAFAAKDQDVRPLTPGAGQEIAAEMGWSAPYAMGVLGRWKITSAYCRAVLRHDQRIALDGAPAEPVGAQAKAVASKQLAERAARQAAKAQKATKAVKKPADTAPADVKPAPAPPPPIETLTQEELRARVRAAMLRRSA